MDRSEFKRELERHKNQVEASIKFLKDGFENLSKRNHEFLSSQSYPFRELCAIMTN